MIHPLFKICSVQMGCHRRPSSFLTRIYCHRAIGLDRPRPRCLIIPPTRLTFQDRGEVQGGVRRGDGTLYELFVQLLPGKTFSTVVLGFPCFCMECVEWDRSMFENVGEAGMMAGSIWWGVIG
jgi:hypothetical protein